MFLLGLQSTHFYCIFLVGCTFEDFGGGDPLCRWRNQNDNYQWKRKNQGTPSTDTGPTFDHTFGTAQGEFSCINRVICDKLWSPRNEFRIVKLGFTFDTIEDQITSIRSVVSNLLKKK